MVPACKQGEFVVTRTQHVRWRGIVHGIGWCIAGIALLHVLSNDTRSEEPKMPIHPLCFVQEIPRQRIPMRIGKITPAPIAHALLIPYFKAPNRERFVACPFVYRQGEPVVLPKDRRPKQGQYESAIVLCPGYLPTTIRVAFFYTDTINGKECQLIEVTKAGNNNEAMRILDDWAVLLGSGSFVVTKAYDVLDDKNYTKGCYATSLELTSPVQQQYRTSYDLWPYDIGTVVKVSLTPEDKKVVNDFFNEEKKKLSSAEASPDDVLSKIEQAATSERDVPSSVYEAVAEGVEKNPAEVSKWLLSRIQEKNLTERRLATYVWALGLTKAPTAIEPIMDLRRQSQFPLVKQNCLRALAAIGGKEAEKYLLSVLDSTTDNEMRFNILNLLGQMQSEAALPKMEEVLRHDPREFYWQSIFVFGKMGDKAVPFLLQEISDKDRNVRANAINVLGTWLIAPEAVKPLRDQFWKETDTELRGVILDSLLKIIADPAQVRSVCEEVIAKEKDENLVKLARKAIDGMDQTKAAIASAANAKHVSEDSFQQEYALLFKSAGKKGDYKVLSSASTMDNEPKLKALRQRILQRDSDEAFYDYQKVNEIILLNRMIGHEKP